MRKINSNSIWNSLPPERRQMFEEWLFEERVGYREAQERAFREWNVTGSLMSICRFYKRIEKERVIGDMAQALETAQEVSQTEAKTQGMYQSGLKVVAMQFLEKAMSRGDVKELSALGRLVSDHEEREIRRGRLALARERFEFRAAKAALEQLPLANEMRAEEDAREDARILAIKQAIFGDEMLEEGGEQHGLTPFNGA